MPRYDTVALLNGKYGFWSLGMRGTIVQILKIFLAVGLLYWLVDSEQLHFSVLSEVGLSWEFGGVLLLLLGNFWGQIQRWLLLLRMQEIRLSFFIGLRLFLIGQFFFITSLGSLGGEVARGYYVARHSGSAKLAGASTVLADRLMGLFTYLMVGGAACLFHLLWGDAAAVLLRFGMVILVLLVAMVLFFLLLWSGWGQKVLFGFLSVQWQERIQQILAAYRLDSGATFAALVYSLLTSLLYLLTFMVASRVLQIPLGWGDLFLSVPLVALMNALPLPLGGLGVGETTLQLLLSQVGLQNGAMIMLLIRVTQWSLVLPFGLYFYLNEKKGAVGG